MESLINIKNHILYSTHKQKQFGIDITYIPNKKHKDIILFVHGFKGFKNWGYFDLMANFFASKGFLFIKMNLSHNGTSIDDPENFNDLKAFSENNFTIELDDINTVIDFIFDNTTIDASEINLKKLCLMAHSRGGYISIIKSIEDRRITNLVTLAAVSDFEKRYSAKEIEYWKKHGTIYIENGRTKQQMPVGYQFYENYINNKERLSVGLNAHKVNIPWLIIHGEEDTSVPVSMAHDLKNWQPNAELFLIPGADHVFGGTHPYLEKELPGHALMAFNKVLTFIQI